MKNIVIGQTFVVTGPKQVGHTDTSWQQGQVWMRIASDFRMGDSIGAVCVASTSLEGKRFIGQTVHMTADNYWNYQKVKMESTISWAGVEKVVVQKTIEVEKTFSIACR